MPYKIDLHTHSHVSPDGSIKTGDYLRMLLQGNLDAVAITDHNTIDEALELHKQLGDRIIVGEEITTTAGEIIGLFLKEAVPPGLSPSETVERIHAQGGLVYIPHPFETVRKGITPQILDRIAKHVDIIEIHNGRAVFQNRSSQAKTWSREHKVSGAAGSDSHGRVGWGKTYTVVDELPTQKNLKKLLQTAHYRHSSPGVRGILYPKFNRLRKKGKRK